MKYTILFELYGKKMKTDVDAATPHQAQEELKEIIANKIIFHKILEPKKQSKNEFINKETENFVNFFNDIVDGKFNK